MSALIRTSDIDLPASDVWRAISGHQFGLNGEASRTLYAIIGRRIPFAGKRSNGKYTSEKSDTYLLFNSLDLPNVTTANDETD